MTLSSKLAELRSLFVEAFALADARRDDALENGGYAAWKPFTVAAMGAVILIALQKYGTSRYFLELVNDWKETDASWLEVWQSDYLKELYGKVWWTSWRVAGYLVVPALFTKLVLKERLRDHGLGLGEARGHLWIYFGAVSLVVPMAIGASFFQGFQNQYPMYPFAGRSWSDLFLWTAMYSAQFLALEFFFRGHWLRTFTPVMGRHAITAMIIPYAMIHMNKNFGEAIGSIAAGLALGALAIRSRCVYPGFLVHASIGFAMDLAALWQKGQWPGG